MFSLFNRLDKCEEDSRHLPEALLTDCSLTAFLSSWRFYATLKRGKKVLRKAQCVSSLHCTYIHGYFQELNIMQTSAKLHCSKKIENFRRSFFVRPTIRTEREKCLKNLIDLRRVRRRLCLRKKKHET